MRPRLVVPMLVVVLAQAGSASAHLLVSEVGYDPVDETGATAEYVEIFNPGPGSVALGNLWLADDEEAYPLLVNGPIASGVTLGDFVYRFPAVSLGAGKVAVVCHDSDAFLAAYFAGGGLAAFSARPGGPVLFEITPDGSGDGVPDMIDYGSNPAGTLSMSNNGECVGLASWDGNSDLVKDHDWVCWLTLTFIPNKDVDYPLGIDGPDAGLDESWFLEDLGTAVAAPDAAEGSSIHRTSSAEAGEVTSGSNGVGGHDETSENWSSWTIGPFSPGVTSLTTVDVAPFVPATSGLHLAVTTRNPFVDRARVSASLPRGGNARLTVHDLAGRRVATLFDGSTHGPTLEAWWDGRDAGGAALAGGLFFLRLEFEGETRTLRLVRLR